MGRGRNEDIAEMEKRITQMKHRLNALAKVKRSQSGQTV
jgi:hypothetical protein